MTLKKIFELFDMLKKQSVKNKAEFRRDIERRLKDIYGKEQLKLSG
ncbi:MAG: hypothetical protein MJB12_14155 [Firmicutes bacterium]|nr:hypothetical protein [Bacillota bacterium]